MKQTLKKVCSIALAVTCMFAFSACSSDQKQESAGIDPTLEMTMATTADGLTETIITLDAEEIADYKESGDAFTVSAMEAWEQSQEELGEFVSKGDASVEESSEGFSVTVPAEFEKNKADLVYEFDEAGMPLSMAVNVDYPMSVLMQRAGMNTIMGLGIVFIMLLFLSFIISLFKFIPKIQAKFEKKETVEPETVPVKAPVAEEVSVQDDSELIAVIAAAIAAAEGTSTDSFVVRSIKKVNRRKW